MKEKLLKKRKVPKSRLQRTSTGESFGYGILPPVVYEPGNKTIYRESATRQRIYRTIIKCS